MIATEEKLTCKCGHDIIKVDGDRIFIAASCQTFFYKDTKSFVGRCAYCGSPYRFVVEYDLTSL